MDPNKQYSIFTQCHHLDVYFTKALFISAACFWEKMLAGLPGTGLKNF